MRIRNNTNKKLVFYFGDSHDEEPEAVITLKVSEDFDLSEAPITDVSIQEE